MTTPNLASSAARVVATEQANRLRPYSRAQDLPHLIGHRYLLMNDQEILAALEVRFASSSRLLAQNYWAHSIHNHYRLRQALHAERKDQAP